MSKLLELVEKVSNEPENIDARMELARKYLDNQDFNNAKMTLEETLKMRPDHLDANYVLGQLCEFDEEYSRAVECFEQVVKQQPTFDLAYKLGQLHESCDQYEKALITYIQCFNAAPQDTNLCERIAHVHRILGNNQEAIHFYKVLLLIEKDNIVALTQLMELYEIENNTWLYNLTKARINEIEGLFSHAISAYKKALPETEKKEDIIKIRLAIADILVKKENYLHAVDEFLAILELDSQNYDMHKNLAETYIKLENTEAACDAFEKAHEIRPEDESVLNELADLYPEIDEHEKALNVAEKLIKLNPDNLANYVNLARTYVALKQDEKAEEQLKSVLERDPDNVEATGVFADFYSLKKDYQKALDCAEKIKKLIPKSPFGYRKAAEIYEIMKQPFESHYNFGVYHDLKGEKQLAIDEFNWALENNPGNLEIILKLASLYEDISEEYIAAEYYQRAYSIDKENITALKKMGDIYLKKKDYQQAIEIYNEILKINPDSKEEYFILAEAYEQSKNYDMALVNFNKYLETTGPSPKSEEANSRIKKLESRINGEDDEGLLNKIFRIFSRN